jgi:anti-anti-sigma factor
MDSEPIKLMTGPPPTVVLTGEIDYRVCVPLRESLFQAVADHEGDLTLDVSRLTYIDSSGIAALLALSQELSEQNRSVRLISPGRFLLHTLNLAGLSRYFVLAPAPVAPPSAPPPSPSAKRPPSPSAEPHRSRSDPSAEPHRSRSDPSKNSWQYTAFTLPCRIDLLSLARVRLMEIAGTAGFSADERDEIELGIGEALTNAVRHGSCLAGETLHLEAECSPEGFTCRITNPGKRFDPDGVPPPSLTRLQEGGMGIYLMRLTMDEVRYTSDGRGTTVKLFKRLNSPPLPVEEGDPQGDEEESESDRTGFPDR